MTGPDRPGDTLVHPPLVHGCSEAPTASGEDLALLLDDAPLDARSDTASLLSDAPLEVPVTLNGSRRLLRRPWRRKTMLALRQEALDAVLVELPLPGEALHLVMDGCSDTYQFLPRALDLLARPADEVLAATWTMNRAFALDFLSQLDRGRIRRAGLLVGEYFKAREPHVFATITEGMLVRGMPIRAHLNHCKLIVLSAAPDFLVFEGSGNWTGNRRAEQMTVTNDRDLFDFHAVWMREVLE